MRVHYLSTVKALLVLVTIELYISRADAAVAGILTNKAFQNYDLKCLPSETVAGLVYKKFVSANGTADLELSLFCRSITGPGDPTPVVTESNCRYGKKFPLQNNSTATINNSNCRRDEYISGFLGTFERSYRMLRLRCCKAENARQDVTLGCRTVGPQGIAAVAKTGLRDPVQPKSGCPRNALSSFNVARGKLTVKFCALALDGAKYESYCYTAKQRVSFLKEKALSAPESDANDIESRRRSSKDAPPHGHIDRNTES